MRDRIWWPPAGKGWWTGVLFAVGSACFAVASFASQWASASRPAIGVTFFAGSLAFTAAAFLQVTATAAGPPRSDRVAALVQFAGTLFFNLSTFEAMQSGFDADQTDLRVWAPDVFGSICFLVASAMAWAAVRGRARSEEWKIAALNLVGSIAFGVAAIASLVEPDDSEPVSAAISNAGTTVGALCFLAGAIMLLPGRAGAPERAREGAT